MENSELQTLKDWLSQRESRISNYRENCSDDHPVLQETQVVLSIIEAIKIGDLNAIELGCELVIETRKLSFGRILKSNGLSALKQQVKHINPEYRQQLSETVVELMSWQHPPSVVIHTVCANSGCSGVQPQGTSSKRYWAYRESEQRRGCAPEQPPSGSSPKAAPLRCCSWQGVQPCLRTAPC